jgi:hypothetical protein
MIQITVDGEETWQTLTAAGGISQADPEWGDFVWTVSPSIGVRDRVIVRVAEYQNPLIAGVSGEFSIVQANTAADRVRQQDSPAGRMQVCSDRTGTTFALEGAGRVAVDICTVGGEKVASLASMGKVRWQGRYPAGIYIARVYGDDAKSGRACLGTVRVTVSGK